MREINMSGGGAMIRKLYMAIESPRGNPGNKTIALSRSKIWSVKSAKHDYNNF